MKWIPLFLGSLSVLGLAAFGARTAPGQDPDLISGDLRIDTVAPTHSFAPDPIAITGTGLDLVRSVDLAGVGPGTILSQSIDTLVVQLPAAEPGFAELVLKNRWEKAGAVVELWPSIRVSMASTEALRQTGTFSPDVAVDQSLPHPTRARFDPAVDEGPPRPTRADVDPAIDHGAIDVVIRTGGPGMYVLNGGLWLRREPMVILDPPTWYGLMLDDPYKLLAFGAMPASGELKLRLRVPLELMGSMLHLQAWCGADARLGMNSFSNLQSIRM